jgi:hypothetical protein
MMEGSNDVAGVASSDEEVEVVVSSKTMKGKNWPHMKHLCVEHKQVLWMILRAVDECKCTTELNATNGDYPKGNKWN